MTDSKLFQVTIEETVVECFDVYAKNIDEAVLIAENKYKNGEFVLSPGDVTNKRIFVIDKDADLEKGWIEF